MDEDVTVPKGWTPPVELTRERPRAVRLAATGVVWSVLSIVLLVGALPIAVTMRVADTRTSARAEALRQEGRDVDAEVLRLRRTGKDKQPRVAYAFAVGNERYESDVEAPLARWSDLRVGGSLPVRFLPSNP